MEDSEIGPSPSCLALQIILRNGDVLRALILCRAPAPGPGALGPGTWDLRPEILDNCGHQAVAIWMAKFPDSDWMKQLGLGIHKRVAPWAMPRVAVAKAGPH